MAMTKCKECGKDVSDKAITCPNCGVSINKDTYTKEIYTAKRIAIIIIMALMLVVAYLFITRYWIPSHTHFKLVNGEYVQEFQFLK